MSVSRSAQCLLSRPLAPRVARVVPTREFHFTAALAERRRSRFKSISEKELRQRLGAPEDATVDDLVRPFSAAETKALEEKYTPEQIEAIKAGEAAIDPRDLARQAVARRDMYRLPYIDDLSVIRPVVDRVPRTKEERMDPRQRLSDEAYTAKDFETRPKAVRELLERGNSPFNLLDKDQQHQYLEDLRTDPQMQSEFADAANFQLEDEHELRVSKPNPNVAPELPKIRAFEGQYEKASETNKQDPDGHYHRLALVTGRTLKDVLSDTTTKILVRRRVVNQTRLGKVQSVYALAVAGNGEGMLGIGEGKSIEAEDAFMQARLAAIRNMKPIPRYEGRTIFGDVDGKVGAVQVQLFTKPPGYGLRCQHLIFEMARAAGITDLGARVPGARNKMNTVKAAYQALVQQRLPEDVAMGRGKKLVDVRKVYYGGSQMKASGRKADKTERAENF